MTKKQPKPVPEKDTRPGHPAEPADVDYKYELVDSTPEKGGAEEKTVFEIRGKNDKIPIAVIRKMDWGKNKGRWYVTSSFQSTHGRGMGIVEDRWNIGTFDVPETAFDVLRNIRRLHLKEVELVPLPEKLREWVERQARDSKDRVSRAESELFAAHARARDLHHLCKQYNLSMSACYTDGSDTAAAARNLVELKLQGAEVPFFSETVLYELVGKDDARTILGMLHRLVSLAAPSEAIRL